MPEPKYIFTCSECKSEYGKFRLRGRTDKCSDCQSRDRLRKWKLLNPEMVKIHGQKYDREKKRLRERQRSHTPEGRANATERANRHYHRDIEASRARTRANYQLNRDREIQKVVDRMDKIRRATPKWAKMCAIASIYANCRRITRETGVEHNVDHIVPLRGKIVSGLHVETNLRIITRRANQEKSDKLIPELLAAGNA